MFSHARMEMFQALTLMESMNNLEIQRRILLLLTQQNGSLVHKLQMFFPVPSHTELGHHIIILPYFYLAADPPLLSPTTLTTCGEGSSPCSEFFFNDIHTF